MLAPHLVVLCSTVALAASLVGGPAVAGPTEGCQRLGRMMRAIATARDEGLPRDQAYAAVTEATSDRAMRAVARIAVDTAYDCPTCSADLLEGTLLGFCEASKTEPSRDAPGRQML